MSLSIRDFVRDPNRPIFRSRHRSLLTFRVDLPLHVQRLISLRNSCVLLSVLSNPPKAPNIPDLVLFRLSKDGS